LVVVVAVMAVGTAQAVGLLFFFVGRVGKSGHLGSGIILSDSFFLFCLFAFLLYSACYFHFYCGFFGVLLFIFSALLDWRDMPECSVLDCIKG
jgi:hypothetical protein